MWDPAIEKGVFLSYWLNAANSDPTSWKCGVVRGPYGCPKIPAQTWQAVFPPQWLNLNFVVQYAPTLSKKFLFEIKYFAWLRTRSSFS
jgi:hypothetical protein